VRYALRTHLARAGIPTVTFHQLRHSAASLLIAQGVPLKVVSQVLGHSTSTITANTYGHLSDELWRGAADAMDRALGQPVARP
jgi:integrase